MPRFTRADLRKILGEAHTDEIESQIMALHLGVVDSLKDDLAKAKADADRLPEVQEELNKLKENSGEDYRQKYEKEHKDFEDYKSQQASKETWASKTAAYRELLKQAGVSEKRLDSVIRVSGSDIDSIELDTEGKVKDSNKVLETVKSSWADFIATPGSKGADTGNPPANGGNKTYSSVEEIIAIRDPAERQKAIADNHELFGI